MDRYNFISKFCRETSGSILVYASLAFIPLVGFAGIAVDSARGYMIKSHLSESLDAASLAAGRALTVEDIEADVTRFFNLNFKSDYMNAALEGPFASYDAETNEITVTASATIDTSFMRILNKQNLTVSAKTKIQRNVRGMELALIMDNTGSMRGGGKMDAMKEAAADLVNILYGEQEEIDNFWVSLTPYSASVNIGNGYDSWLQGYTPSDYTGTVWKGCVEARAGGEDQTDTIPANSLFTPYLYPDDVDNNYPPIREENSWQNNGLGPNLGCGPAITPLTGIKTTVIDAIDEMLPWHRGGTLTNLGLVWGWRTISPQWRGLWDGDDMSLPKDYDEPLVDKVAIILTDGTNQFFDYEGGGPDGSDYTAYGRKNWGRLGETSNSRVTREINDRMSDTCEAMKDEGIILYTITFQLNNTTSQDLFRECATSTAHYFNSPSNSELRSVFQKIGNELSNLRIVE